MPLWTRYLAAVVVIAAGYLAGPLRFGPVFNVLGASSVVALLVGARLYLPRRSRLPWYLLAVGQTVFIVGDLLSYNQGALLGREPSYPSVADVFYLATYPALAGGLFGLIRRRSPARDWASLIDALILAVAVGTLLWVYLMAPYAGDHSLSAMARLTSMSYPLMDLLLATVVLRLAVGAGQRGVAFGLLCGALLALFATDVGYGWLLLHGGYTPDALLDAGWLSFYALLGSAALHPSMSRLSQPARGAGARLTRARLTLLAAACLLAPGVQLFNVAMSRPLDVLAITTSSIALSLLVLARLAGIVCRLEATARHLAHLAHHDPLTGLPNRASFRTSVERALARARRSGELVAVLFIDLDDFKTVNDNFGHAAGDTLLEDVASRIAQCVRAGDTAARLGGDEFAVLLVDVDGEAEAVQIAQRITQAVELSNASAALVQTRASIGIALGDDPDTASADTMLRAADAAMYAAKDDGGGGCRVFSDAPCAALVKPAHS